MRVVTRAQMRAEGLRHRCVYIGVVDRAGRLLVHQRAADKDVYPSYWDVAAGGVCSAGETWEETARRELREELGVEAPLEDLGQGSWSSADVSVVGRTFLARHDGPFTFADGEIVTARFVARPELETLLRTEPFCPDSLALALPRFLEQPGRK